MSVKGYETALPVKNEDDVNSSLAGIQRELIYFFQDIFCTIYNCLKLIKNRRYNFNINEGTFKIYIDVF